MNKPNLQDYLSASYPCIFFRTHDIDTAEKRIDTILKSFKVTRDYFEKDAKGNLVPKKATLSFGSWKVTTGLVVSNSYKSVYHNDGKGKIVAKPIYEALNHIERLDESEPIIAVFHNIRQFIGRGFAMNIQQLLDTATACRTNGSTIILVGASIDIPSELTSVITICDCNLPDKSEIKKIYMKITKKYLESSEWKGKLNFPKQKKEFVELIENAAKSALGLDDINAENAYALSISMKKSLDIKVIQSQKEQEISKSDVLEFVPTEESIKTIGGFTYFKEWLISRKDVFSDEARKYGLPYPKGVLVCGSPGTGKSLSAKVAASYLGIPLIRLDMGAVFKTYLGESEESIRNALKIADAVSPCVLWMDEIDKNMAGAESSGNLDSGVTARVLSTLLTWRQETKSAVMLFATANDVEKIPSMMYRKGRLDEVWFVDLPSKSEREIIFRIHIEKKKRNEKKFDCVKLANATPGFCGSEIESVVEGAMFIGYENKREFTTGDIIKAIEITIPQAVRDKEEIDRLRKWGKERARPVSDTEVVVKVPIKKSRTIRSSTNLN